MGASTLGSRAIIGTFYNRLEVLTGASWVNALSMYFASNQASEDYKWLGMSPRMREWVGGRHAKGLRENGLTIINKKYEATLELDVDEMRRDKTGQIMIRLDEMAMGTVEHWATLLSLFIDAGEGTTYGNAYDAVPFFSASHSNGDSGTWKNLLTSSEVPALNVSTASAPTPTEFAKAIFAVIAYLMKNVKDDQGQMFNKTARNWAVMVGSPDIYVPLEQATTNRVVIDTGGAAYDNPMPQSKFKVSAEFNPELTSFNGFYITRTDSIVKPFIRQEEVGVKMSAVAEGSELEFENDVHHYGIKALRNVGYGYPELMAKCTFD